MGMSSGSSGGRAPLSEINVTPLVDVMLVLLVIFMVTAPLMTAGVEVALPRAEAEPMPLEEEKLLLVIDAEQNVWLRVVGTDRPEDTRDLIPFERLLEVLSTNAILRSTHEIYVQADQAVSYGFVAQVLAICRQAGVENLGLVTDPRGGGPPTPATPTEAPIE
ncbi:MAG: biopolymer transporter ExbD [Sandaracinaceae bacterium]|nr:biopolymer transporter ExbD [Sandaracinaceae bacterium]